MKKSSSKTSKKKSFNKKKITWLGIDIHHIALGVSIVGCLVALFLVKQQKALEEQAQVLSAEAQTTFAAPFIRTGTIPPCDSCGLTPPPVQVTCIPRPACLDATPRCMIPEPVGGWCHTPISPPPSLTPPPGCYYGACTLACPQNNPNCCQNFQRPLICPSGMPQPSVTPPQGCFYKEFCVMAACQADTACNNGCKKVLICPSGMPRPSISYLPRPSCSPAPTCNQKLGIACRINPCGQEPTFIPKPSCMQRPPCEAGKVCPQLNPNIIWCPISATPSGQTNGTPSAQPVSGEKNMNPVMVLWNTFLRKLFGL